jgi:amino acid transporter
VSATVEHVAARPQLLRILGAVFGVAVGIGSMIGAGILRTPGSVAHAVPAYWWIIGLWGFAAIHAMLTANILAELYTAMPRAGGPYVPVRRLFGDLPGLLVGVCDALNSAASTAALALAGVDFLALTWPAASRYPVSIASAIIAALFVINATGVREGRAAQITMTMIKIALLLLIVLGASLLPPAPAALSAGIAPAIGLAGVIAAYQLISGAYSGWPNPVYFAEEDVAPSRNIPRALYGSIVGVAALYLLINFALLRVNGVAVLGGQEIPVGVLIDRLTGGVGPALLGIIGFILIIGCCHAGLMVAPRIVFGLARDGLIPRFCAQVSRSGTPQVGLAIVTLASAALAVTGSFEAAFRLVATTGVALSLLLDLAFFALRYREPELARPYAARGYPWLPAAALLLDLAFLVSILWFDPLSGLITIGTLAVVSVVWLVARAALRRPRAQAT